MSLYQIVDDKVRLTLHPGQTKAWDSDARFVFMLAGTQGGKTSFGPWWLWERIKENGPGDYLAVTASFDLFKLKMLPEMRTIFERVLSVGRFWAGDKVIELKDMATGRFHAKASTDPMWGRIILRSAQSEGGLESATAKAAWLDECGQNNFPLRQWEAVLRRLSLHQGRALGTTTLYNRGWVKTQIYDRWKAGDPDYDVIQFASYVNPAFPRTEYERAERTLATWKLRMFYQGLFDKPAGLIYDCFDEDLHIINSFRIPRDWPRVVGIDPVGAVVTAIFLAWDDASQRLHWYDEYYGPYGKTTEEHANEVKKKAAEQGGPVVAWIAGAKSERQARLDWQAAGIPVIEPPISDVESGIDRVYGLFKGHWLVVHRSCKHSLAEIGSYSRVLDENDEATEVIQDKHDYHCCDGGRYGIAWLTEPQETTSVIYPIQQIGRY